MERGELAEALRPWRTATAPRSEAGTVLIAESDPERFMAAFADAVAGKSEIFLCDPKWGRQELDQLARRTERSSAAAGAADPGAGWLMIPTGGSSGALKFARHDSRTLGAAVRGFAIHFGIEKVNALGVLPLHHVSGLMAWLRCALTGGRFRSLDWRLVEGGALPPAAPQSDRTVLSLVPTQLERLLATAHGTAFLRQFHIVFLGGGPSWPSLLDRAAQERLPVSLSYGMTETAAMVTAQRPDEFLAGRRDCGTALPHAIVTLGPDQVVQVAGAALFRGYHPEWRAEPALLTGDLGRLDGRGHLTVLGRRDGIIISGGEKINPAEVEAVLRGTDEFDDVVVVGLPDAQWGEVVAAAYPATRQPDLDRVGQSLQEQLAPYKRPKHLVAIDQWTRSATGKVDRAGLLRTIEARLRATTGA